MLTLSTFKAGLVDNEAHQAKQLGDDIHGLLGGELAPMWARQNDGGVMVPFAHHCPRQSQPPSFAT